MSKFYIFSDIETDALRGDRLLQLAAVASDGQTFNKFINPKRPLLESCTTFTGLHYCKGKLYQNGVIKPTVSVSEALTLFTIWLDKFNKPVTLVFHNGFTFDCKILARHYSRLGITPPGELVKIVDTLPGFRKHIKNPGPLNHKLVTLTKFFELPEGRAHDALYDSQVLKTICEKVALKYDITFEDLFKCSKERDFKFYIQEELSGSQSKANKKSVKPESSQK